MTTATYAIYREVTTRTGTIAVHALAHRNMETGDQRTQCTQATVNFLMVQIETGRATEARHTLSTRGAVQGRLRIGTSWGRISPRASCRSGAAVFVWRFGGVRIINRISMSCLGNRDNQGALLLSPNLIYPPFRTIILPLFTSSAEPELNQPYLFSFHTGRRH